MYNRNINLLKGNVRSVKTDHIVQQNNKTRLYGKKT